MTEKYKRRSLRKLSRLDNKFKAGFLSSHKLSWFEFDAFLCVSGMKKVSSMLRKIAWQLEFHAWHWKIFTLWWRRKRGWRSGEIFLIGNVIFFYIWIYLVSSKVNNNPSFSYFSILELEKSFLKNLYYRQCHQHTAVVRNSSLFSCQSNKHFKILYFNTAWDL